MAKSLVETMSDKWSPNQFKDEYRQKLLKVIEEKVARGGKGAPDKVKPKAATNVVDLVAVLQKSLAESKKKPAGSTHSSHHHAKKKLKKAAWPNYT